MALRFQADGVMDIAQKRVSLIMRCGHQRNHGMAAAHLAWRKTTAAEKYPAASITTRVGMALKNRALAPWRTRQQRSWRQHGRHRAQRIGKMASAWRESESRQSGVKTSAAKTYRAKSVSSKQWWQRRA